VEQVNRQTDTKRCETRTIIIKLFYFYKTGSFNYIRPDRGLINGLTVVFCSVREALLYESKHSSLFLPITC